MQRQKQRQRHRQRVGRRASTCTPGAKHSHRLSLACLPSLLLVLLVALGARESECQGLALKGDLQNKEVIPNTEYKLKNLHKQHDSGPQWLDIVKARGFIGELYTIVSRDGTPLSVYHLVNPLANPKTLNKYPVLIFHGVLSDAAQMVSHSETSKPRAPVPGQIFADSTDTALAFMLANNNFDVWMCDARGTNLNNHLVSDDLNILQAQKYWNWSLDEQVHYDLPTLIDFVLTETYEDKLHYVGYSESTYMMFALLASHPDYQDKIATYTALAPVAYVSHITGLALAQFSTSALVPDSINGNFVPQLITDTLSTTGRQLCQVSVFTRTLCPFLISGISGVGDTAITNAWYGAASKSTSIKAVKHFMQQYSYKRFAMYDYGPSGNMRQYGQPASPVYHLQNIKLPSIVLVRGGKDFLSTPEDQKRLLAELGVRPYLDLNYPIYNHLDMLIGRNVVKEVNLPVARAMYDWSRQWASRAGLKTILKDPAKTLLKKPVAPVAVVTPDGSRKITIGSSLVSNLVNGLVQTTNKKIINNDGGQLTAIPVSDSSVNSPNPLTAITGSLSSVLPILG